MTIAISDFQKNQDSAASEPVLYLAADLGKSDCKFLYWQGSQDYTPLWLGASLVEGVDDEVVRFFEVGGELSETAWLTVGGRNILVGNSARSYSESFRAHKKETASYRIAAALGIAAIELGLTHYRAMVSVVIPFNEFSSRSEIVDQIEAIGQGFVCCGRHQQFDLTISFYPEGTGLYLLHRKTRQAETAAPYHRTVITLMLGHRNLSMLVFNRGKLDPVLSQTSDRLGFWESFKSDAAKVQVRETDFPSLQRALFSGEAEQFSAAAGKRLDYALAVRAIRAGLMGRIQPFLRDVVGELLVTVPDADLLLGGGMAHLLRSELRDYFAQLTPQTPLYFADEAGGPLLLLAEQSRGGEYDLARPMRFADVYGIAIVLARR